MKTLDFNAIHVGPSAQKTPNVSQILAVGLALAVKDKGYSQYDKGIVFLKDPGGPDVLSIDEGHVIYQGKRIEPGPVPPLDMPHMALVNYLGYGEEMRAVFPWWKSWSFPGDPDTGGCSETDVLEQRWYHDMHVNPLAEVVRIEWSEAGGDRPVGYPLEGLLCRLGSRILDKLVRYRAFMSLCDERPVEYYWNDIPVLDYSWVDERDLDMVECAVRSRTGVVVYPCGDKTGFRPQFLDAKCNLGLAEDWDWFDEILAGSLFTKRKANPKLIREVITTITAEKHFHVD